VQKVSSQLGTWPLCTRTKWQAARNGRARTDRPVQERPAGNRYCLAYTAECMHCTALHSLPVQ